MIYDALTATALRQNLNRKLSHGRVQKVTQINELCITLEIYAQQQRHNLVISADPQVGGVYLTGQALRRGIETETPMLQLLRKYLRGAWVEEITQPPWERILHLVFSSSAGDTRLIVELTGRMANLILVDATSVIMAAVRHITSQMTSARTILPRLPYAPPPPQQRLPPDQVTPLLLEQLLAAVPAGTPLWRALQQGFAGISPQTGREWAFRAHGAADVPAGEINDTAPLMAASQQLFFPLQDENWHPSVSPDLPHARACAPYLLTHLGTYVPVADMLEAVNICVAAFSSLDPYGERRKRLGEIINQARERLERRRQALQRQHIDPAEVQRLREAGEWILAYSTQISSGQQELLVPLDPDPPLRIPLDPQQTPIANAQAYFSRYEKSRDAAQEIPQRLAAVNLELAYLDQLDSDLALAQNQPELEEVRAALGERGIIRHRPGSKRSKSPPSQPLRLVTQADLTILIGRNSRQNEQVTFDLAQPDDLWLHARGVPGAHVIIRGEGKPIPERVIQQAAALAAYYSQARNQTHAAVDVTERRHVRRIKGGGPGMVSYRNERTIHVTPAATLD